jgi:hypothetical protein
MILLGGVGATKEKHNVAERKRTQLSSTQGGDLWILQVVPFAPKHPLWSLSQANPPDKTRAFSWQVSAEAPSKIGRFLEAAAVTPAIIGVKGVLRVMPEAYHIPQFDPLPLEPIQHV